jgi:hypothetical protein
VQFVLGPWRDLRYTYLLSSLALALPFPVLTLISTFQIVPTADRAVFVIIWAVLHMLLYPLARELYFGLTEPIRRGMAGLILWGPLALAIFVLRFMVYCFLSAMAVPIGIVAFIYLSLRARYGW